MKIINQQNSVLVEFGAKMDRRIRVVFAVQGLMFLGWQQGLGTVYMPSLKK